MEQHKQLHGSFKQSTKHTLPEAVSQYLASIPEQNTLARGTELQSRSNWHVNILQLLLLTDVDKTQRLCIKSIRGVNGHRHAHIICWLYVIYLTFIIVSSDYNVHQHLQFQFSGLNIKIFPELNDFSVWSQCQHKQSKVFKLFCTQAGNLVL